MDADDHRPLYEQVREALRAQLVSGRYRPGDRLPTEAELRHDFGVSLITLRRAVGDLVQEGWLIRRQGRGTFVRAQRVDHELAYLTDFVEDMRRAGLEPESRVLHFEPEPAPDAAAQALDLPPETPVMRLDRLRLGDGAPIALDRTWLPLRFGLGLTREDLERHTIFELLENRYATPIEAGTHDIDAGLAEPALAASLQVPASSPLLVIDRTSFAAGGVPICFQRRYYRPDRVRYRITLRRPARTAARGRAESLEHFGPVFAGRGAGT